ILRHGVLLRDLRLFVGIDEFIRDLVVSRLVQIEQIAGRSVIAAGIERLDVKILLYLLDHPGGLIRQAVNLLACRIDPFHMLGAEVVYKGQNSDEEHNRRRRIDSESGGPPAEAGPNLRCLQTDGYDNENGANDDRDGLIYGPNRSN